MGTAGSCTSFANTNCSDILSSRPNSPSEVYATSLQQDVETRTCAALPPKVPKRPPAAKGKQPLRANQTGKEETVAREADRIPQSIIQTNDVAASTHEVTEYSHADKRLEGESEAWGTAPRQNVGQVVPRYHDRAAGLSWQQRLEQLEFSDDDDDCEEDGSLVGSI